MAIKERGGVALASAVVVVVVVVVVGRVNCRLSSVVVVVVRSGLKLEGPTV